MADDPKAPPQVDAAAWTPEDDQSLLSFHLGENWYFFPATPFVYRVPPAEAAQLRARGIIGVGATGHSGAALVSTGHGEAFLIDAGTKGPPGSAMAAMFVEQIDALCDRMGVRRLTGIEITHGHVDHINRVREMILRDNIPAERIRIADFQARAAQPLLRIWDELATTPKGIELGYARVDPGMDLYRRLAEPDVRYFRHHFERGDVVVEYFVNPAAVQALANRPLFKADGSPVESIPSHLVDSAAQMMMIKQAATHFRVLVVGDLRGRDYAAMKAAMESAAPGSWGEMFRGSANLLGFQHHLGAVDAADVEGIVDLLEVTALGGRGRLDATVQTSTRQMNELLVNGLRELGVTLNVSLRGAGGEPASIVVDSNNQVTLSGDAVHTFEATPGGAAVRARLAALWNQKLALDHYGQNLAEMGIELGRPLDEVKAELETAIRTVQVLYRRRGDIVLGAVAAKAPLTETQEKEVQANTAEILKVRAIDRIFETAHASETLVKYGLMQVRLTFARDDLEREVAKLRETGEPSPRLLQLIETVTPGYFRTLLAMTGSGPKANRELLESLLVQEQEMNVLKAELGLTPTHPGGPQLSGTQRTIVGALALVAVANELLGQIGEIRRLQDANRRSAAATLRWWIQRGVVPPFSGYVNHLFSHDVITGSSQVIAALNDDQLSALIVENITDDAAWLQFGLWAAEHLKNFDDYQEQLLAPPLAAIRVTPGQSWLDGTWEMRTWKWTGGLTGPGQDMEWVPNAQLTKIMQAVAKRVVANTERDLRRLWEERDHVAIADPTHPRFVAADAFHSPDGNLVAIVDTAKLASAPIAPARPGRKLNFKPDAADRNAYSRIDQGAAVTAWTTEPQFYEVEASNVPAGYVAVIGSDFNTYARLKESNAGAIALLKKDAVEPPGTVHLTLPPPAGSNAGGIFLDGSGIGVIHGGVVTNPVIRRGG
jgi:hypothetical protein